MRYVAFLHTDGDGWGISFPDFPGCVSNGATEDEALARGEEALGFHVEGMMEDGEALPEPRSVAVAMADPDLAEWRDGALVAYVPLLVDRGSPRRVNVSLDAGLLDAIDREARRRRMTRSAFLSSAARAELRGEHGA